MVIERGEFSGKHRTINRLSGRPYSREWEKRWFQFPIPPPALTQQYFSGQRLLVELDALVAEHIDVLVRDALQVRECSSRSVCRFSFGEPE
jgi:hypothetical protein